MAADPLAQVVIMPHQSSCNYHHRRYFVDASLFLLLYGSCAQYVARI